MDLESHSQSKPENGLKFHQKVSRAGRSDQLLALIWCARGGIIDKVNTVAPLSIRRHLEVVGAHSKPTFEARNITTGLRGTCLRTYLVPNPPRSSIGPSSYQRPVSSPLRPSVLGL